jgi:uncharacterized protein (TIGR00369 family)
MSEVADIPAGFERHFRQSPLTDPWEPLYSRREARKIVLGLRVAPRHCNNKGFAHGGLIASLADNAMGLSCGQAVGTGPGFVTVSLSLDYLKPAAVGQWLEFDTAFVKTGSTLSFAQAFVTADGEPCARASAVFRALPRSE